MKNPARIIDFLLLGGGLASATAAETLRLEGAQGSIVIVAAEPHLPYHRPPLLAQLMTKPLPPPPMPVLTDDDCRRLGIEVLRGVRALGVDVEKHIVRTDQVGELAYRKLLIATGASALRLELPGAELAGIHYLRTVEDAHAIHRAARHAKRCVVIGASFVGMEAAAGLRQRGLAVQLVTGEAGIFASLRDPQVAKFFATLYAEKGIEVMGGAAARFEGGRSVEAVVLDDGRRLPCDFVLAGVGVRPDIDFLRDSGIALGDGVLVDGHLQANVPDVYAAGDVANFLDPVFKVRRRIEHWDNAVKQGRLAARNMLAQRLRYDEVSGFFCHVFDVSFQFLGRAEDAPERRTLGVRKDRSWARLFLQDDVPRALFTMARPARETATIEALIRYRTDVGRLERDFGRPGFVLTDIPSQTVLVLQGGGAIGAFECGVVQALEEQGVRPDIVAGVSIGAFNAAILASHPGHAKEALASFWHELATASPSWGGAAAGKVGGSLSALLFGVPKFFVPRWLSWSANPLEWLQAWTSFYDPAPMRRLLTQYVDFKALETGSVRLLVSAVNVETGQLEVFDSYVDTFTVDHLMASGSLPPGLPWTTIDGKHYWDGGIVSNSPLDQVVERCGAAGKRVFVVDLFPQAKPLPANMVEVVARRDEIVYAERIRRAGTEQALLQDARKLIDAILSRVDEATASRIRELPPYVQVMGAPHGPMITRIVRLGTAGEPAGRDFDFSAASIDELVREGVDAGRRALAGEVQEPHATPVRMLHPGLDAAPPNR